VGVTGDAVPYVPRYETKLEAPYHEVIESECLIQNISTTLSGVFVFLNFHSIQRSFSY